MTTSSQEPNPTGKVICSTSKGDIEIELWGNQAPKAVRNFIQLSLEHYYDGCIFHRLVPNFIVQTGDPTGSGFGGISIYDDNFKDEFHSRLRFNRRGLIGMANTGKNDNASQWFITLDATPELQHKNTLFGRVVGDTLFNVLKIADLETNANERPLYPPTISYMTVIVNPFTDIVPRSYQPIHQENDAPKHTESKHKNPRKEVALSFDHDEEETTIRPKKKELARNEKSPSPSPPSIRSKTIAEDSRKKSPRPYDAVPQIEAHEPNDSAEALHAKIADLKAEMKEARRPKPNTGKGHQKISLVEQQRQQFQNSQKATVGKRKRDRESEMLTALSGFRKKLSQSQESKPLDIPIGPECELHGVPDCQSCTWFEHIMDEESEQKPSEWLGHRLVFTNDHLGKNGTRRRAEDDLEVIDPKAKERELLSETSHTANKVVR